MNSKYRAPHASRFFFLYFNVFVSKQTITMPGLINDFLTSEIANVQISRRDCAIIIRRGGESHIEPHIEKYYVEAPCRWRQV